MNHSSTNKLLEGPTEKDIVLASLEESMIDSVKEIKKIAIEQNLSMRMAAYVYAIEKVHKHYDVAGQYN